MYRSAVLFGVIFAILIIAFSWGHSNTVDGPIILAGSARLLNHEEVYQQKYAYPMPTAILLTPLALLPQEDQQDAFFFFNIVLLLSSAAMIGYTTKQMLLCTTIALTFAPVWWTINTGQSDIILIWAMSSYYFFAQFKDSGSKFYAGFALAAMIIKPQFAIPVFAHTIDTRRINKDVWTGIIIYGATMLLLCLAIDPLWFLKWNLALQQYTNDGLATTLGAGPAIRQLFGVWSVLIALPVAMFLQTFTGSHYEDWEALTMSILIAMIFAPVSHTYDLALLIVPILLVITNEKDWSAWLLTLPVFATPMLWKLFAWSDEILAPLMLMSYIGILLVIGMSINQRSYRTSVA